ncbi:MAG: transporter related protein [Gemmatimonadetes bacterium]|jgi:iron complex transport system ATP-binding protein|nr:transporter related protein [Gemmatimonadota bacterium]
MITFRNVVVRYPRQERPALADVSLEAARARLTAVVGPNGSGKSTLVRALLGRTDVVDGAVLVDGVAISAMGRRALATRVAVVTQREEPAFPLAVREYVALGRYPHLGMWRGARREDAVAVAEALAVTGTEHLAMRLITELSGGEWQRVRLARAVAQGGEAIVLDEPTTFLDVGHEMAVFELLARLARDGRAVLLVSHQLNLVARFADHIVLLHQGAVACAGSANDVMQGAVLERVYEWPLVITRDPAVGAPALVPLRSRSR